MEKPDVFKAVVAGLVILGAGALFLWRSPDEGNASISVETAAEPVPMEADQVGRGSRRKPPPPPPARISEDIG